MWNCIYISFVGKQLVHVRAWIARLAETGDIDRFYDGE